MLRRLIFWEYRRGSWQYDVIVGLIVAFIFLTPRPWFRDWPRTPQAQVIATMPGGYFVSPEQLEELPDSQLMVKITERVRAHAHNPRLSVTRVEPILDSEGELLGYVVFAQ